ncbi:MAG: NAD-binding protein [Parasutterella excrementihominis]
MKYLVIGLGTYGRELAINLSLQGNEVIGVDHRSENIEAVKEQLMTVYELDAKDENSLKLLPLKNMDIVIVAIGEDFGASLKTVALLKKNGVKHIYARAIDNLHQSHSLKHLILNASDAGKKSRKRFNAGTQSE